MNNLRRYGNSASRQFVSEWECIGKAGILYNSDGAVQTQVDRAGKKTKPQLETKMRISSLVCVGFFAVFGVIPVLAQVPEPILVMADGDGYEQKALVNKVPLDGTEVLLADVTQDGLTIHVYSKDPAGTGFRDASLGPDRVDCIVDVLTYVEDVLNVTGELDFLLGLSQSDGSGPLAEGGTFFPATGLTNGYAFQRIDTGIKPYMGYPEMLINFDWGHPWYAGAELPPIDKFDLRSVVLHEVTHTLGFLSNINRTPSLPFTYLDSNLAYSVSMSPLIVGATFDSSLTFTLTSDKIIFKGTEAYGAMGNVYPSVHSSSPFSLGTSLQHWKSGAIPGGAVMEPSYAPGTAKRTYAAVDIAALADIGWITAAPADHQASCVLSSVTIAEPSASSYVVGSSNTATVQFRTTVARDTSSGCLVTPGQVQVDYYLNSARRGSSTDEANDFALDLDLAPAGYTVRAVAKHLENASNVEASKSFTVIAQPPAQPVLQVSPTETTYDFGQVKSGESVDVVYTVRNGGDGTLNGAASLTGAEEFAFVGASTYALAHNAESSVTVRFLPGAKGDFAGTLNFGGNGGNTQVSLSGKGVKSGGLFNCSGTVSSEQNSLTADFFVVVLALGAVIVGAYRQRMNRF
jgi:hypothetical protein